MSIHNSNKQQLFITLLEHASINTLVPLLSAKSRWILLLEILLGHAPIKGGRTRDFPFSKQRTTNTALSLLLINEQCKGFIPGTNKQKGRDFSQYDLIIAIMILEISEEEKYPNATVDQEMHYSFTMRLLISELFPAPENIEISDLLGISLHGIDASSSIKHHIKDNLRFAKVMAVIAQEASFANKQTLTEMRTQFALKKNDINRLETASIDLIISKTKKVQQQLNRCRHPFIQRGVSYWCSQILSRTRDSVKKVQTNSTYILTDCDAVTIQAVSSSIDEASLHCAIKQQFTDKNQQLSSDFIYRYYPRLQTYYNAAIQQGVDTDTVLPAIGNILLEKCSLLQLCCEYSHPSPAKPIDYKDHLITFREAKISNSGYPCSGMHGDESLEDQKLEVPYWFSKQRDEMYGWASTLLSLVGMSYRQTTNNTIAQYLSASTGKQVKSTNKPEQSSSQSKNTETHITYLKFDGDKVGQLFTSQPVLSRPALAIKLETLIRDSLLESLTELCQQNSFTHVPIDLLYFGGDDLCLTICSKQVNDFLPLFNQALSNNQKTLNLQIMFSFIAVSVPLKYKKEKLPDGSFIESKVLSEVNSLLEQVKTNVPLARQIARRELRVEKQHNLSCIKGVSSLLC